MVEVNVSANVVALDGSSAAKKFEERHVENTCRFVSGTVHYQELAITEHV